MDTKKAYQLHLNGPEDLKTTYEEYRTGFLTFALEKNKRSTPFIERAKALKAFASKATRPTDLLDIEEIQDALLYASGISDKAKKFFREQDKEESIKNLIENFLEPAGSDFIEELVFRYLLFQGDSLGGSMRNIAGAIAQQKLTRSIISILELTSTPYKWLDSRDKKGTNWMDKPDDDFELEAFAKGLSWQSEGIHKTLMYNIKVPLVRKNVDICLFNSRPEDYKKDKVNDIPEKYLLLGELKGGIDPAGADEHWKTANSALERIRDKFTQSGLSPATVFIGAAIESSMAEEIWHQHESGRLTNSANLTNPDQLNSVCNWIIHV